MIITIPIEPVAKQRPKFTKKGFAYTPKKTREYEEAVREYAKRSIISPLSGEIRVLMEFYLPIPKSWSKTKYGLAMEKKIRPAVKPDLDNLAKAVMDALNKGVGYEDDKQIVELGVKKYYGEPRIIIKMEEI